MRQSASLATRLVSGYGMFGVPLKLELTIGVWVFMLGLLFLAGDNCLLGPGLCPETCLTRRLSKAGDNRGSRDQNAVLCGFSH